MRRNNQPIQKKLVGPHGLIYFVQQGVSIGDREILQRWLHDYQ
jgi:hypothetical protein